MSGQPAGAYSPVPAPGGSHHHALTGALNGALTPSLTATLTLSGDIDGPPRIHAVHRPVATTTPYGRHHAFSPLLPFSTLPEPGGVLLPVRPVGQT